MHLIIISCLFNIFWFAAVLGRQQMMPLLLLMLTIIFILKPKLMVPAISLALVGITGDALLAFEQVLIFNTDILPLWLCLLWFAFGAYIGFIKEILLSKPKWLIILIGIVGGTLSYIAGERFGAVNFHYSFWHTSLLLALAWFGYSAIFILILKKFALKETINDRQK